jgi:monoamine oxidase
VFWLRVLQSNAAIKTIRGGVSALVDGLAAKVRAAGAEIRTGHRLVAISEAPGSERLLALRMERADGAVVVVHARRVVLALPAPALARLEIALPDDVRGILGDVVPMRMTKCFFLVDRPWWDDDRAQTHVGTDRCPAREIHYYSAPDRSVGMVMVYCDEPTFDFWAPLAAEDRKAEREATFAAVMGISPTRVLDSRVIDWTRVPELGAAAWFWKPGVRIYDAMRRLAAFDLAGDERDAASPRLSICGCAYSDFQGFIEGALRTAESTLDALRAPARAPEITTGLPLAMPA